MFLAAAPAFAGCAPTTIYFASGSADVDDESRRALQRLALSLAWKGSDLHRLVLTSHTDSAGSALANRRMAMRRATAVRDILLSFAVPKEAITVRAVGEAEPRVLTPADVREPRNRRVELLVQMSAEAQGRLLAEGRPIC